MKKVLKYGLLVFILWFCIHSIAIVIDGLTDEISKTDVVVIFGNKVEANGQPSKRLKSRLDKGIELYENKNAKKIIVSGGIGKEGFDEGLIMKLYLTKNNIPEKDVITDNKGVNTYMTAKNVKEIMEKNNFSSVTLVTQYYHISRSELAFKKFGIENVYSVHANIFELRDPYSISREFLAYYKYLFRTY